MGKSQSYNNDQGKQIDKAEPATPIEILGINGASKSGDDFIVLKTEKEAKSLCDGRIQVEERKSIVFCHSRSGLMIHCRRTKYNN